MNIKSEKLLTILSKIVFILYIIILLWAIIFKCNLFDSINKLYAYYLPKSLTERFTTFLIPFQDYFKGQFVVQRDVLLKDDILNVIIFIPLGLYVSFFVEEKKALKTLLITICLSLVLEVFQLFSLIGSFATKDIITNALGGMLGYLAYRLIYKRDNPPLKIMILNIISLVVILVALSIAIYAIVNTAKNFDIYLQVFTRTLDVIEQ